MVSDFRAAKPRYGLKKTAPDGAVTSQKAAKQPLTIRFRPLLGDQQ